MMKNENEINFLSDFYKKKKYFNGNFINATLSMWEGDFFPSNIFFSRVYSICI